MEVAVVQLSSTSERERNLARAEELVRKAHGERGARLLCLPEVFAWRGPSTQEAEIAEPVPGPVTERMGRLAAELGIHLLLGSMLEKHAGDRRPYNTSVLLGPDGQIQKTYRKIHLFDVDVEGYGAVRESATRLPGNEVVVADVMLERGKPPVRLGLSVCYDLRFPELYRRLVLAGAQVLCVPASFTTRTGRDHWFPLLTARAIENLCFVLAPGQWGMGREGIDTYGRSVIIDPWGTHLAVCPDGEGYASARLDLEAQARIRTTFPVLTHVRRGTLI